MKHDKQPNPEGHRVRLPQDVETPLTTLTTPSGTALYLYARSGDSVTAHTIGQDYVAFRYGAHDLTFAVCDGVGQSFMGDLAARLLGDGLNAWLWQIERPADAPAFSQEVANALNELTTVGAERVAAFRLPGNLPPMLVQALEGQRKYGSESMFVAGRIALGGDTPWVALCWLGDSPVAAIDIDGKLVDLGPKGHTSERWNAATGVKGEVHTWVGSAEHVARVAGYTDGLGMEHVPTDADIARLMELWAATPPSDDASLFDVRLAPSPETTGQDHAPEPGELRVLDFVPDSSRPIVVPEERSPVARVDPIEAGQADTAAVEGWRPLAGEESAQPPAETPAPTLQTAAELLQKAAQGAAAPGGLGEPTVQQIQMWQQAALLGLTSAALAMLMVERLIKDQQSGGTDRDAGSQAG